MLFYDLIMKLRGNLVALLFLTLLGNGHSDYDDATDYYIVLGYLHTDVGLHYTSPKCEQQGAFNQNRDLLLDISTFLVICVVQNLTKD